MNVNTTVENSYSKLVGVMKWDKKDHMQKQL